MREALGIYTTGFGFGLPTDGIHGPNEKCALSRALDRTRVHPAHLLMRMRAQVPAVPAAAGQQGVCAAAAQAGTERARWRAGGSNHQRQRAHDRQRRALDGHPMPDELLVAVPRVTHRQTCPCADPHHFFLLTEARDQKQTWKT